jgi:signal transduction histidine kinase
MARKRPVADRSGWTILVVDDQEETLISTRLLLESEGHRVITAASGQAAIAAFSADPADLVIVDYFMPRMSGHQVVEAIRESDQDVQILLQTGYSGERPPDEMMQTLAIQGYHDKADGPDRLLLWVRASLKAAAQIGKVREAGRRLRESEAQLRLLSARLLKLQEEERDRISRELHDELGQLLTAIALDIDWLSSHADADRQLKAERLAESKVLVHRAINATRELCASLRVEEWQGKCLAASIGDYAADFQRRSGIITRFSNPGGNLELNAETARNVFRIVQEGLSNVARHAQAREVAIELRPFDGSLVLSLTDDGKGFDHDQVSDPFAIGLTGMRERARLIGGRLELRTSKGGGTSLKVTVPIASAKGENHGV